MATASRNLEERIDALVDAHPALQRLLNNGADVKGNTFLADVRKKFVDSGRLSDRQIAAVAASFARGDQRQQWAAEKADRQKKIAEEKKALAAAGVKAPEGRVEFEGEIVSVKWHEGQYGYGYGARRSGSYKIVVKTSEGWACWVSLPPELSADGLEVKGRRIRLTATLTQSDRDQLFAFGKRPSGASFVS